jgi:hypothetical protein
MILQFAVIGLGRRSLPRCDTILHDGDVLVVGRSKKALDRSPLVEPDGP